MPLYEYTCRECGLEFEQMARVKFRNNVTCPSCGSPTDKRISAPSDPKVSFRPGWYENFTREPIYIESESDLREKERKYGVEFKGGWSRSRTFDLREHIMKREEDARETAERKSS